MKKQFNPMPLLMAMLFVVLLLLLVHLKGNAQECEPETNVYPSATTEITSDWGMIIQGGFTGQRWPISLHAGIRYREFVDNISEAKPVQEAKLLPRIEIGIRIINGLHLNFGTGGRNDVSLTAYRRLGEKIAIYGRGMYDGAVMFGMGVKVLFYSY